MDNFRVPPNQFAPPPADDLWRQPGQFSPPPADDLWRQPGQFSAPPAEANYRADPGVLRPTGPPRSSRPAPPPRSRRTLAGVLIAVLAAGLAAVAVYELVPSHATKTSPGAGQATTIQLGTTQASSTSPSPSSGVTSSPPPISEQQAASNLAALLGQSVQDRSSIVAAANDVSNCGPTLSQDPQTFQNAVASRQQLLGQLASLPGRSVLPAAMLQALTGAWQASEAADGDLGKWAQDEVSGGCTQNDQADANFQAAVAPDNQATTDKKAFVSQWNPIASQYGLTTYQWNQL